MLVPWDVLFSKARWSQRMDSAGCHFSLCWSPEVTARPPACTNLENQPF
jgi:hypothetical protein